VSEICEDWDDAALARAAKQGNSEARNALFMRKRTVIGSLSWKSQQIAGKGSQGPGAITPEDVEQQAFLVFCDLLREWEEARLDFCDFLRAVMPWRMLHYVRSATRYRLRKRVLRLAGNIEKRVFEWPSLDAEHDFLEVDDRDAWDQQTADLSDEWKRIITMRYEQDLPSDEIATREGRSTRTINRHLRAANASIRRKIEDESA